MPGQRPIRLLSRQISSKSNIPVKRPRSRDRFVDRRLERRNSLVVDGWRGSNPWTQLHHRPRHGRVGERCRVARWSSITWAAHAEIDGSTCIRDNAPCRTGCSVGWLSSTPHRESPLWLQTPSPVSVHLSLRLSPSPSLPPSPPSLSVPRSLNLLCGERPFHSPLPSLLRRFRRTCPSRSSDSITCPLRLAFLKRFQKFVTFHRRCFGINGMNFSKDFSKKIRADKFGSRFHRAPPTECSRSSQRDSCPRYSGQVDLTCRTTNLCLTCSN